MVPLVFLSHSPGDTVFRDALCRHLTPAVHGGLLRIWHQGKVLPGVVPQVEARAQLEASSIIVILVSSDYLAKEQTLAEMQRAVARADARCARLVPILLRPCNLKGSPLARMQHLPRNGAAVSASADQEETWAQIVDVLLAVAENDLAALEGPRSVTPPAPLSGSSGQARLSVSMKQLLAKTQEAKLSERRQGETPEPPREPDQAALTPPAPFSEAGRTRAPTPPIPSLKSVDIEGAAQSLPRPPDFQLRLRRPLWLAAAVVALSAGLFSLYTCADGGPVTSATTSGSTPIASSPAHAPPVIATTPSSPQEITPICVSGMIAIPGGTFLMGSKPSEKLDKADADEVRHEVTLSAFCIDRTEVSVRAYRECASKVQHEVQCPAPPTTLLDSRLREEDAKALSAYCNAQSAERAEHPMNCVDWSMADAYCRWAGKSLPTEAQWEYAARGLTGRKYPWGDEPPSARRLNAHGDEGHRMKGVLGQIDNRMYKDSDPWATTSPPGATEGDVSAFGVRDMGGNVNEWMQDWYGPYADLEARDPLRDRKADKPLRVLRGASWLDADPSLARAANRHAHEPGSRSPAFGFRCASPQGR